MQRKSLKKGPAVSTGDWISVWENRKHVLGEWEGTPSLADLIRLDGFDVGAGGISESDWLQGAKEARRILELGGGESVLELGSGAGAFLRALEIEGGGRNSSMSLGLTSLRNLLKLQGLCCLTGAFSTII